MEWCGLMPTRLVREGIITSESVDLLEPAEEVFYRRLMNKVDDHGLYDARPSILRAALFPLRLDRVREADISRWMAACQKAGLIVLYEAAGKQLLCLLKTGWDKRSKPKYPLPPENSCKQLQTDESISTVVVVESVVDKKHSRASHVSCPDGVDEKVWNDFNVMRKAKNSPMTDTALAGIRREAAKANITLQSALEIACERGWRGFKAEWVTSDKSTTIQVDG
jgi:hypothetical protein